MRTEPGAAVCRATDRLGGYANGSGVAWLVASKSDKRPVDSRADSRAAAPVPGPSGRRVPIGGFGPSHRRFRLPRAALALGFFGKRSVSAHLKGLGGVRTAVNFAEMHHAAGRDVRGPVQVEVLGVLKMPEARVQ
eukprot:9475177-Pyramimonas_sp.AAC.1